MTCREAAALLDRLMDGELTEGERRALEAHGAGCESCARAIRAAEEMKALFDDMPLEVDVPLPAQARWREAVKSEAKQRRGVKLIRRYGAVAAAVVVLAGTGLALGLRDAPRMNANGGGVLPRPAAQARVEQLDRPEAASAAEDAPAAMPEGEGLMAEAAHESEPAATFEPAATAEPMAEGESLMAEAAYEDEPEYEGLDLSRDNDASAYEADGDAGDAPVMSWGANPPSVAGDEDAAAQEWAFEGEAMPMEDAGDAAPEAAEYDAPGAQMPVPDASGDAAPVQGSEYGALEDDVERLLSRGLALVEADGIELEATQPPMCAALALGGPARELEMTVEDVPQAQAAICDLAREYEAEVAAQSAAGGSVNLYIDIPARNLADFLSALSPMNLSGEEWACEVPEGDQTVSLLLVVRAAE